MRGAKVSLFYHLLPYPLFLISLPTTYFLILYEIMATSSARPSKRSTKHPKCTRDYYLAKEGFSQRDATRRVGVQYFEKLHTFDYLNQIDKLGKDNAGGA
jgi:hypothetical protein